MSWTSDGLAEHAVGESNVGSQARPKHDELGYTNFVGEFFTFRLKPDEIRPFLAMLTISGAVNL